MSDYHVNGAGDPANGLSYPCHNVLAKGDEARFDEMATLIALARDAGMLITLDGQIGREKYQSIAGSLTSLHCFAVKLQDLLLARTTSQGSTEHARRGTADVSESFMIALLRKAADRPASGG
jgi:hypothetical protein